MQSMLTLCAESEYIRVCEGGVVRWEGWICGMGACIVHVCDCAYWHV